MASYITNRAKLDYTAGASALSTLSNTASIAVTEAFRTTKYALETAYRIDDSLTYDVFLVNTSGAALNQLEIVDDLGTFLVTGTVKATPLTYVGPAKAYIDSVSAGIVNAVVSAEKDAVTFSLPALPAGSSLHLTYKVRVNEYAPAAVGSSTIRNTVSVTATEQTTPITASHSIPIEAYTDIIIDKSMAPDPYDRGETITYTFQIRNYGTIPAENVVLTDNFSPIPAITGVTLNDVPVSAASYSLTGGLFLYPADGSGVDFTIDAARFTTDPATGLTAIDPGIATFQIRGTVNA